MYVDFLPSFYHLQYTISRYVQDHSKCCRIVNKGLRCYGPLQVLILAIIMSLVTMCIVISMMLHCDRW